jgi:hypothetical protein
VFEVGEKVCDSSVNPVDVSLVHVALVPEYQRYEYEGEPIVGADIVSVVDCPVSIMELVAVGADDATSAGLTVSVCI